jgi:hypothetical protein
MAAYELWESIDNPGAALFFPADRRTHHVISGEPARDRITGESLRLIWTVDATDWEAAMAAKRAWLDQASSRPME